MKHIFVISAAVLYLVGLSRPAAAQIYSRTDTNGVLTLSDRPFTGSAKLTGAATARVGLLPLGSVGSTYDPLIRQHASLQGVRADLVRAVIQVESAFNPRALSPKGAMGLMQLMPATAAQFGVIDPFNPAENIRAGVKYLRMLLDKYNDNEQLALAAYNAGPGAVDKYGSKIPPYKETRNYVQRITNLKGNTSATAGPRIYKVTEIVDGRPVVKYTNSKPTSGIFEEVGR
ncbi:MAG: lytic transglycosylase domain-containing protein [Vicinamibacterales bacterium]|nr:lytic transglycosylase domain-containing protein [Vicinamibacterales bacterium]